MKSENLSTEIDKSEVLEVQKTSKRHSFTNLSNLPALAAVKEENEDPPGSTETESDDEKVSKITLIFNYITEEKCKICFFITLSLTCILVLKFPIRV